jgi:hypothetical protein
VEGEGKEEGGRKEIEGERVISSFFTFAVYIR